VTTNDPNPRPLNAIITTPVVWITTVSTMSDTPKIQFARSNISRSVGHT
jgi:hypothetical protein